MGLISCTSFCSAAISFWYGVKLIAKENYDGGTVIVVSKTIDAAIYLCVNGSCCFYLETNAGCNELKCLSCLKETRGTITGV